MKVINCEKTSIRIKSLLNQSGITSKMVQETLGLGSVQAVYKWLDSKNKTLPSIQSLVGLSEMLGCDIEDILVFDDVTIN